jgi:hypothetical protein
LHHAYTFEGDLYYRGQVLIPGRGNTATAEA